MRKLTDKEINELLSYALAAAKENVALTVVFERFAAKYGRAKDGVRNLYYALLKSAERGGEIVEKYPPLKDLKANRARAFTDREQEELFESIRCGVKKGVSARKTIRALAGGDEKIALRYQNKYRNMLKERGMTKTRVYFDDEKYKAVKKAIDELFERTLKAGREENAALREENKALKEMIRSLSPSEKTQNVKNFFAKKGDGKNELKSK